jgi:signal transduction histidine kinase
MLQACAEAMVSHADAAFARIWTLDESEQILHLQASAGMHTHLDGPHGRVPVGKFKIGLIAQERQPHLTNDLAGDPRVADQEWVRREGLVSFAGYPLMVGSHLVGVLATFSRHRLREADKPALGAVAHSIAIGIRRTQQEEALRLSERDLRARADELARLARALERSNRELDTFAYAASHDLRAPLRGISNLAQWIEEDLQGEALIKDDTREMLHLMRSRMYRMEALIEGLLQYSRAGRVHQEPELVDTRRLVRDAADLISPPDGTAIVIADDLPSLRAEKLPLQQVFMNLVSNAVKHAGRDDLQVRISARDAGEFYEFAVQDNGPGVAAEYHDRIWNIFQTLEARDKVEGTGIGLALVKKIVEAQGGRAWVESKDGEGATFKFLWRKLA